jgi:predicted transcriptional regulator
VLKIQADSRQVPSIEKYTANKKYHDLLYGVLQEISYGEKLPGEEVMSRYVNKKDFTYQTLGDRIGLNRVSTSKYFKHLIELGLIEEDKDSKRYKLLYLDKSIATLIPFETLRKLNNSLNHNAISVYVYLLKRYIAAGEQEYIYTRNQLKAFCGIATNTNSNDEVIIDILQVLELIGLIERKYMQTEDNKTITYITCVRNQIKEIKH